MAELCGSRLVSVLARPDDAVGPCKVGRWLAELDGQESAAVEAAVEHRPIHTVFSQLVAANIRPCSASTWRRHWQGQCACPQS